MVQAQAGISVSVSRLNQNEYMMALGDCGVSALWMTLPMGIGDVEEAMFRCLVCSYLSRA